MGLRLLVSYRPLAHFLRALPKAILREADPRPIDTLDWAYTARATLQLELPRAVKLINP